MENKDRGVTKMNQETTNEKKKHFLKWLTRNHTFKVRESLWILDYLYNHETMLEKSHFVEEVDQTPRGIYLSVAGVEKADFIFYKNGRSYKDPVQAFHEVRLNWSSDLYLQVDFEEAWQSKEYLSVLEDNPYAPWNEQVSFEMFLEMKRALRYEGLARRKVVLLEGINESLTLEDRKQFNELSKELEELEKSIKELILEG